MKTKGTMKRDCRLWVFITVLAVWVLSSCVTVTPAPDQDQPVKDGKPNVILIHGFGNILSPDSNLMKWSMTEFYWGRWVQEAFSDVKVEYIYWDSTKRIEQQLGDIVEQFKTHLHSGHCPEGCLVFTHSTGGLVIDILLSRAYESRGKENDFSQIWDQTIASVNIASAGGGVGLATVLTDLVMGNCNAILTSLFSFLECGKPASLGVGHDLRPDEARLINHSDYVRTPSLMIAGFGLMIPSLMRLSLMGESDGLVAMHSACGGNRFPPSENMAAESCSPFLAPDGGIQPQQTPDPYRFHYPIIMTKEGHVSQLRRGLLNSDFLTDKTETLVFYDEDGRISEKVPQRFAGEKTLNFNNANNHLSDIVGDCFNLRNDRLQKKPELSGNLSREDFKRNMMAIARSYGTLLGYPAYSFPLTPQDYSLLNPGKSNTIYKSFAYDGYAAGIHLPRYVLFRGNPISLSFRIKSNSTRPLPEFEYVKGEVLDEEGEVTHRFDFTNTHSSQTVQIYKSVFLPAETDFASLAPEVNFKVLFKRKEGQKESMTKMVKYLPSVASITAKGEEYVDGTFLMIPLEMEVEQSGYYTVTANLFDEKTGEPVAHLKGEEYLSKAGGTIRLRVLSRILKERRMPGPYRLKDFMIARVPDQFEETRRFGDANDQQFDIERFELDLYTAEEVNLPFEEAKLKRFQRFVHSLPE